jgi:hypothetical protein
LLYFLSTLGLPPLPIATFYKVDEKFAAFLEWLLAGWSVLLLITTAVAFSYMESRPSRQPAWQE